MRKMKSETQWVAVLFFLAGLLVLAAKVLG